MPIPKETDQARFMWVGCCFLLVQCLQILRPLLDVKLLYRRRNLLEEHTDLRPDRLAKTTVLHDPGLLDLLTVSKSRQFWICTRAVSLAHVSLQAFVACSLVGSRETFVQMSYKELQGLSACRACYFELWKWGIWLWTTAGQIGCFYATPTTTKNAIMTSGRDCEQLHNRSKQVLHAENLDNMTARFLDPEACCPEGTQHACTSWLMSFTLVPVHCLLKCRCQVYEILTQQVMTYVGDP